MNVTTTAIEGLLIFESKVHGDARGWFMESFSQERFNAAVGRTVQFVQDNHSHSQCGVLRGLHYQMPPHAQGKLVRVSSGAVWDVAVDLRKASSTFGQWFGLELSSQNQKQLWIPEGFAHGFVTLSETADFLYKTTAYYAPDADRGIAWNDTELAVQWPTTSARPQISGKDQQAPSFSAAVAAGFAF